MNFEISPETGNLKFFQAIHECLLGDPLQSRIFLLVLVD